MAGAKADLEHAAFGARHDLLALITDGLRAHRGIQQPRQNEMIVKAHDRFAPKRPYHNVSDRDRHRAEAGRHRSELGFFRPLVVERPRIEIEATDRTMRETENGAGAEGGKDRL